MFTVKSEPLIEIVGEGGELVLATVPANSKSFPVWKLFKYQVPVLLEAPQIVHRNVTVVEDERFCNALIPFMAIPF